MFIPYTHSKTFATIYIPRNGTYADMTQYTLNIAENISFIELLYCLRSKTSFRSRKDVFRTKKRISPASIQLLISTVLPSREKPQTPDMPVAVVMETGYSTAFWGVKERAVFHLAQTEPAEVSFRFVLRSETDSSPNEVRLVCQMLQLILYPFPSFLRLVYLRQPCSGLFSCRSSRSGPHQHRPQTSNNSTGKSRMRLDPVRMDMENVVYRIQCVVHEKGDHIEGLSHVVAEEVILLNKGSILVPPVGFRTLAMEHNPIPNPTRGIRIDPKELQCAVISSL
ncbi:hypothetical protein AVEN_158088-1 [Araneus ventricosus]|uniref:Uncharacterized protein n=1 Tax=Araneus ventricosus TaxID=182803 RepID=A0A4Y2HSX2_ARAVE|nr:hypothetical protein AVEN_158088-1 [Araneus ventricosus]